MGSRSASFPRCVGIDSSAPRLPSRLSGAPRGWSFTDSERASIGPSARKSSLVDEASRASRGLVDTSIVLDLDHIDAGQLPSELAISALTMAELAAGPHATGDAGERARRQDRLQRAEAAFDPLPFDGESARAYGRIYAAVVAIGRKARGPRAVDLLIAATALAADLPLYTRNVDDFRGMEHLLTIIAV
jgi:predicted nucleic acid-binding protein